jgi:hypothetical protein
VPDNGDPRGITVKNFGSFDALYAELVEPWLGKWDELRATYARLRAGEITEEQGAEEITLRAKPGRPKKGEDNPVHAQDIQHGTGNRAYVLARLRRDDPDLAARVERGELSANAAARAKGWRKPADAYRELVRWWERADRRQRDAFLAYLDVWIRGASAPPRPTPPEPEKRPGRRASTPAATTAWGEA